MAHKNKDLELGNRLKNLRKTRNLKQKEVAKMIKISSGSVGNHERGLMPSIDIINKYIYLYKCNQKWLMTGEGSPDDPNEFQSVVENVKNKGKKPQPDESATKNEQQSLLMRMQDNLLSEIEKNRELQKENAELRKKLEQAKGGKITPDTDS